MSRPNIVLAKGGLSRAMLHGCLNLFKQFVQAETSKHLSREEFLMFCLMSSDDSCFIILALNTEQHRWPHISKRTKNSPNLTHCVFSFFAFKGIAVQKAMSKRHSAGYMMTQGLFLYFKRFFLFIFSSPTDDWCDTEGQQRTTILGVGADRAELETMATQCLPL